MKAYVALARNHFNVDEFETFCDRHLQQLDEVAHEFFASDIVHKAIRDKVTALYPVAEIDTFVELFWSRIQDWRRIEGTGP